MNAESTDDPATLRLDETETQAAWAAQVRAARDQLDRCREVEDPVDFYGPMAQRFDQDPQRTDERALDVLLGLARPAQTWLDIGAGGGRYSLPLALKVERVEAVEPSPVMLAVLRSGMTEHGIGNIGIHERKWPFRDEQPPSADVALMAHVGYDVEAFGVFLDAAEAAVSRRCVVIMRQTSATAPAHVLWETVHGEPRAALPMLPELMALLLARGAAPEVTLAQRPTWGYTARDELVEAAYRQLWVRPDSAKGTQVKALVLDRAQEQDGQWALDWSPMRDGVVSWRPRQTPG